MRLVKGGKMIAYVLDSDDLSIKDLLEFDEWEFKRDSEFANKSSIVVHRMPSIAKDDFVLCQCNGSNVFSGICKDYSSDSDSNEYKIQLVQQECLFDREIFVGNEALISSTGIEDYIAAVIRSNWISSGDALIDKSYMTVTASTHTPIHASVSTTVDVRDGAYNLKTYLGNVLEFYGIHVNFDFSSSGTLLVTIYHDTTATSSLDATITDVSNYTEVYSVDALAKLNVQYYQRNGDSSSYVGSYTYYLLANRTITTNKTNPNRAKGTVKSMIIEADSADEMYQKVLDTFSSNSYAHKISFSLYMDSKLYDYSEMFIGQSFNILTKSGIHNSIVTGINIDSDSRFAQIVFGKLKVTLIEKIRSME